ncbi:MAG: DUF2256 domain-containing protein [Porticoccaceae bacterium]|nr:DUF2256 domain-containing protein [Porticoccaceae bacterium]
MPAIRKKAFFPTKICSACERPFTWRKKWKRSWDEVRFCSIRCKATFHKKSK